MVSVIVPMYNTASFLENCVSSILNNTYQDYELLLINDGSKDNTLEVARELSKKDKRIRVIDKEHVSVGHTRNRGLDEAKGEYVCFVDSDDTIESSFLQELLSYSEKEYLDCCICGYIEKISNKNISSNKKIFDHTLVFSNDELSIARNALFMPIYENNKRLFSSCMCILKKSVIDEYELRFIENVQYGEDTLFMYSFLGHCKKIGYIDKALYIYNIHNYNHILKNDLSIINTIEAFEKERKKQNATLTTEMQRYYLHLLRDYLTVVVYGEQTTTDKTKINRFKEAIKSSASVSTIIDKLDFNVPTTLHDKIELFIIKHRLFYLGAILRKILHLTS